VIVDSAEVSDPGSTAYFGGSKWASAVEVPEAGVNYYLPQGCSARAGARDLVSLQRDGHVATRIRLPAAGL